MWKRIIVALICMFLFATVAHASVETEQDAALSGYEQQLEASGANELIEQAPQQTQDLLGELGIDKVDHETLLTLSPREFFRALYEIALGALKRPVSSLAAIIGLIALDALAKGLKLSLAHGNIDTVFSAVSVLCVVTVTIGPVLGCIQTAVNTIAAAADLMLVLVPVLVSVVAVSGQVVTATTYNAFLFLSTEAVAQLATNVFAPLACIYLAICIVGAVSDTFSLGGIADAVKSTVTWGLGLISTLYVGLLGLQSGVAAGADSITMRTTKFLVGSFVPVIGSAMSEALSTAQSCIRLVKTSVGAFGILAVALTFLPVLIELVMWYLTVNVSGALAKAADLDQMSRVLKGCGTALGFLLSILVITALLFLVSIGIVITRGAGG